MAPVVAGSLLCASVAPASVPAVQAAPVVTMDSALMAVVIVVPPTQVVDPLTGTKDNQTNVMWGLLNGWVAAQAGGDQSNLRYVQYPQSVWWLTGPGDPTADKSRQIGKANLNQLIEAAKQSGQPIVVVGYSQGASVNTEWLKGYKQGEFPNAPDPSTLSFVNIGNPNRPNGGPAERFAGLYVPILGVSFDGATPSDTPYQVTEVAHEYDGISDFPVYVLNPLADINAVMGMAFVHAFYDQVDLNDPNNIVTHDGNLTDVLVPTPILPIMQPLYIAAHLAGRTETPVLDAVSGPLRVIIDSAYDRTTAGATPANFGNPFQNLDTAELKASLEQSADILLHGAPGPTSSRTFTQFPDLSGVVRALTASPTDTSALNQAAVQSAENYLYGTPKAPAATQPPAAKDPGPEAASQPTSKKPAALQLPKLPKLPKLPSFGKPADTADATPKSSAKPGWKPGDGIKAAVGAVNKLTHGAISGADSHKAGQPSGKSAGAGS